MKLKQYVYCGALAISTLFAAAPVHAQAAYPTHSITMIVGFPPGGGTDILARELGTEMSKVLGQPVVVENRGGANGIIGTGVLAKAAPDGHTIMMTISSHVTNTLLYKDLPYQLSDFTPVSVVARSPFVLLANPQFAPNDVKQLMDLAHAKPGSINYGSPGQGSTQHLSHELMNLMARIDMVHVPYRGGAPAMNDLLANQISMMFLTTVQSLPYLKDNRLKALGVSSEKRVKLLPDVPAIAETIPGYASDVWFGVIAPKGTPEPIVDKLQKTISEILKTPKMQQRIDSFGAEPVGNTSSEFAALISDEEKKWGDVLQKAKIKIEK